MIILPALLQFNLRKTPLTKELRHLWGFFDILNPAALLMGKATGFSFLVLIYCSSSNWPVEIPALIALRTPSSCSFKGTSGLYCTGFATVMRRFSKSICTG